MIASTVGYIIVLHCHGTACDEGLRGNDLECKADRAVKVRVRVRARVRVRVKVRVRVRVRVRGWRCGYGYD